MDSSWLRPKITHFSTFVRKITLIIDISSIPFLWITEIQIQLVVLVSALECSRDGQYSLANLFLSFFFSSTLLTVPPCPAICTKWGHVPRAPWSRRPWLGCTEMHLVIGSLAMLKTLKSIVIKICTRIKLRSRYLDMQGQRLRGNRGDCPPQIFRWRGQRCFYPPNV